MHYQDEIRELEVRSRSDEKPGVVELKLATQLIESISSDTFDAKAYHDEYRQRVMDLIEQKSKGKSSEVECESSQVGHASGGSDAASQGQRRSDRTEKKHPVAGVTGAGSP